MGDKEKVAEEKITYDGVFAFKDLYNFVYTLLVDNEYGVEEKSYKEKTAQGAKEIEIAWDAKRKVSDYTRYLWKVSWRILGMTSVEVMKDGRKVKMNKGSVEIKIGTFIETDYENRWQSSAFMKFLRGIYDKFVIKKQIDEYKSNLGKEVGDATNQVKSYLVLEGKR